MFGGCGLYSDLDQGTTLMANNLGLTSDQERTIKQLLRRAAKRTRPSQLYSSIVPHGQETDANREFASHREENSLVWFFLFLPAFVIVWAICVKIGVV